MGGPATSAYIPAVTASRQDGIGFRVLGPIELARDDQTVTVGHAKQRSVLAVLLVEANRTVVTEQLIDRVWGEEPPARVRNVLSGYITRLRSVIVAAAGQTDEVTLTRRSGGYLLAVPPGQVDLHRFRALVSLAQTTGPAQRVGLLGEALGLWRGPAFAATGGAWLDGMRAALARERLTAEIARAGAGLELGRHAQIVDELGALAARYPLDERVAAQLMLALRGSGRTAEALAVYAATRGRLADELGVDPGAQLRRLHRRLLHNEEPVSPPPDASTVDAPSSAVLLGRGVVPRQLPPAAAHFVGRAEHLRQLQHQTTAAGRSHTVAISLIHGSAGVGKTALAVHWAQHAAARFPDGQLYLNLRGFDQDQPPLQPSEALTAALRALDIAPPHIPTTVDEQASLYRSVVADKRLLILLDNAASTGQVRPLLPGAPGCMVLVTSRNELSGLVAGDGAARLALDVLDPPDAIALLRRIVGEHRVIAEIDVATALARLCARLPLALRVMANHLLARPDAALADTLDELADERHRLDVLSTDDESTTVRAAFSLSYHSLKPEAAGLFRLLSLHQGAQLGEPAAAALAGLPLPRARQLLAVLCQGHLLERVGSRRYQSHDLLRLYAAERVQVEEPAGERRRVVRRVLHWYLATAAAADRILAPERFRGALDDLPPADPVIPFAGHGTALAWYDTELHNLVAAVRQAAAAGEHVLAWQLAWAQWGYFQLRKPWTEWLTTHEIGLASARRCGDRSAEALMLNSLGMAHYYPRRFAEAQGCFERALAIWRELGDARGQASVTNNLGNLLLETRQLPDAIAHYEQALVLYGPIGHDAGTTLTNLAEAHCLLRQFELGLDWARQALASHDATGSRRGQALTLCQYGNALCGLDRLDEAVEHYTRALAISHAIGDRQAEGWASHFLAEALHTAGRPTEARRHWRVALTAFDTLGDPQSGDIRTRLAALY
jgi:DNA-binding SARP family transcriptional activator/tetratricopeptide (TPR) repeat protein